ncbi:alpha/beta fold hydrolase [Pseudonocardia lutea]|jgi:pimeloyl-ACP methyl ester carboxylesterase|uniref:Alpha/beta fold hydrolase n=1 Tax=Pseudonocardia lutea TaxID=2172015 RepID=A0ABW1IB16_9PSEU
MAERMVEVGDGVRLRVTEEGSGRPVILAHGFPELAYSWRHQIPALAAEGYRAVAPDQRGYGGSSRPERVEDYDIHHLTGDLVALLDDLGEERAVFVGHDWGAMVVWNLALLHPERVAGVCGMSVPFVPRAQRPPTEIWREKLAGKFFYILHFQQPGVADAEMAKDPARTMRGMLSGLVAGDGTRLIGPDDGRGIVERLPQPESLPGWLTQEELDHYAAEFARTGFTGGINWYRNFDRNWERTPGLAGAHVTVPSFFLAGDADPVLRMTPPDRQAEYLDDLRGEVLVEGAGHWVQQERPTEVNTALLGFLRGIDW